MEITTEFLVEISLSIISFSIAVIFAALVYLFFTSGKTPEEKKADNIIKKMDLLKKSNYSKANEENISIQSAKSDFEKTDSSLKGLLIKKFKPKIEAQLGSKIDILEFKLTEKGLTALIDVSEIKILLSLDSSGKIIDYKKVNVRA